ncbi:ATP synthase F0 subunit B [Alphaproteobacteria bacterium]|nr:ATP synthase F0 subunit B [Alphaproteobacteria bacterium]
MINHLLEDPKFWLLVCFITFVIIMIKPFKKFMIGGLDKKIEEIKKNINLSLESFTIAEKKLNEATQSTKDLELKIKTIVDDAKVQADVVSKSMIEKNHNAIISKEKNSLERIKQIELATIQTIKSQTSIKLNEILIKYFSNMPKEVKTDIIKNKIEELNSIQ